ncbi:hypothetical protein G6F18_012318 [Rhizopus arrhizus]|nr:hypothetical protein G6F18_012318 [Rhizopus arrhizus]
MCRKSDESIDSKLKTRMVTYGDNGRENDQLNLIDHIGYKLHQGQAKELSCASIHDKEFYREADDTRRYGHDETTDATKKFSMR